MKWVYKSLYSVFISNFIGIGVGFNRCKHNQQWVYMFLIAGKYLAQVAELKTCQVLKEKCIHSSLHDINHRQKGKNSCMKFILHPCLEVLYIIWMQDARFLHYCNSSREPVPLFLACWHLLFSTSKRGCYPCYYSSGTKLIHPTGSPQVPIILSNLPGIMSSRVWSRR